MTMMLLEPRTAVEVGTCRFCEECEGTLRVLVLPHERLTLCETCISDLRWVLQDADPRAQQWLAEQADHVRRRQGGGTAAPGEKQ